MSWDGRERRASLTISGPYGLRVLFVGSCWAAFWLLVGTSASLGYCVWAR